MQKEKLRLTWKPPVSSGITKIEVDVITPDGGTVTSEVQPGDAEFVYLADFGANLVFKGRVFRGNQSVESQELSYTVVADPLLPMTDLAVEDLGPVEA